MNDWDNNNYGFTIICQVVITLSFVGCLIAGDNIWLTVVIGLVFLNISFQTYKVIWGNKKKLQSPE